VGWVETYGAVYQFLCCVDKPGQPQNEWRLKTRTGNMATINNDTTATEALRAYNE
jgi:hypothetical protein